ncbi:hypothetical protein LPW33_02340 [Ectothiorhodospira variabilis]|nr:protein YgfX [Ectothiorhodospira variabilis]MCG5493003.1 hypothetical protein [Ectothiorhodospira variabilis]MCG5497276.1 hypothetical protein [Ectothiorhodospira variabilis]MCG5502332.1 hypothetical protein [Ectothiorhodospira variabilis]MCG5505902.1 hypothetical protein [Ectothiorhodospira variabilis]
MDRKQENKALCVTVGRSLWVRMVMGAMYAAASGAVLISGTPGSVKAALVLFLVGSILSAWVGHRQGRAGTIEVLGCHGDGQWWMRQAGDQPIRVCILPDTVVLPWLVLLSMRCERGRYHRLPLMADAVDADDLRRLRVRLRAGVASASAVAPRRRVVVILNRLTSRWARREGVDGG